MIPFRNKDTYTGTRICICLTEQILKCQEQPEETLGGVRLLSLFSATHPRHLIVPNEYALFA